MTNQPTPLWLIVLVCLLLLTVGVAFADRAPTYYETWAGPQATPDLRVMREQIMTECEE